MIVSCVHSDCFPRAERAPSRCLFRVVGLNEPLAISRLFGSGGIDGLMADSAARSIKPDGYTLLVVRRVRGQN